MNANIHHAVTTTAMISRGLGFVRVGEIEIVATVHNEIEGAYCLQARSARHNYPIAQNVIDACEILGIKPIAEVVGNGSGLWARVTVSANEIDAGNFLALIVRKEADARSTALTLALVESTTAEA